MSYNPDLHHRRSIRLKGYDYSQAGAYFVTICTEERECLFGNIEQGEMRVNDFGKAIAESWLWLAEQYAYVDLDEWIAMPNHLHGIIVIRDDHDESRRGGFTNRPYNAQIIRTPDRSIQDGLHQTDQ